MLLHNRNYQQNIVDIKIFLSPPTQQLFTASAQVYNELCKYAAILDIAQKGYCPIIFFIFTIITSPEKTPELTSYVMS